MSYIGGEDRYIRPVFQFRRMAGRGLGKNLFNNFLDDSDIQSDDAIKVFLRLKPTTDNNVIEVLDSKTVLFKMPPELMHSKRKLNLTDEYKYTFSNIFRPIVTQAEIFTGCVTPLVKDLFNAQHCLLFTYGTTNAGKTFTILGTGEQPGIIPRTLSTVFKTITGQEYKNDRIRPWMFNSAVEVSDQMLQDERDYKQNILNWSHERTQSETSRLCKTQSTVSSSVDEIIGETVFKEMQKRLTNDTSIIELQSEPDDRFSVWVSFAEIYNEAIFDLLQPVSPSNKRKPLKLAQDKNRNTYIKELKHIMVHSEEEAFNVLMFGKNNLQVAATGMNASSSRSHCIFTIKLLKCPNVESPERVSVSSFSICDLAGAERQKKTLNVGPRLKESQNINGSLLVLSRCFYLIRENQKKDEHQLIPFRDSKLTQLFQHALLGKETVTMIVNVNPDKHMAEETQHVLKASAIAKHIVVQPRPPKRPLRNTRYSTFSQIITNHNRSTLIRWDSCVKAKAPDSLSGESCVITEEGPTINEKKQQEYEELLALVETLKDKLKEERTKHQQIKKDWAKREDEIREECQALRPVKQPDRQDFEKVRNSTFRPIFDERKISDEDCILAKKAKRHVNDEYKLSDDIEELREDIRMQQKQIDSLTDLVNLHKDDKKELTMEVTNLKYRLGEKDKEIKNLNNKLEVFGEESEVKEAYLALEKEMAQKIKARDDLLEEARADLLEEISNNEDNEDEIQRLEKELVEKEEEIIHLQSEVENYKREASDKTRAIEMLEARIDEVESDFYDQIKFKDKHCMEVEKELADKKQEIEKLNEKLASLEDVINCSKEIRNQLELSTLTKEEEIFKMNQEFEGRLNTEINNRKLKHDMEISARDDNIKCLQDEVASISLKFEEVKNSLEDKLDEHYDEELVKVIVQTTEECNVKMENLQKEFDVKKIELENRVLELEKQLDDEVKARDLIKEDLEAIQKKTKDLQQLLAEKSIQIENLQKVIDSIQDTSKKTESELSAELSTMEQSLKQQIKETTRLLKIKDEKVKENEQLKKELFRAKSVSEELKSALSKKQHDLECCVSKMSGYENSIPTLQAEFDRQRQELSMYKTKCEHQIAAMCNLEQEQNSFQANQKDIIGKYEEQLKKSKEENDNLKKEVARVTNTFYKSTPTPKKDLEKQISILKKENEELNKHLEECRSHNYTLNEENKSFITKLAYGKSMNKENSVELIYKPEAHGKTQSTLNRVNLPQESDDVFSLRPRAMSSCEEGRSVIDDMKKSKSTTKTRPKRTTRANNVSTASNIESENKLRENPPQRHPVVRRKLMTSNPHEEEVNFEDVEIDLNVPHDSPGSIVKRSLRTRNK